MYKIKDESEHHYEIETPEGQSFHIAKEGLSKKMHSNIKKMCEGGMAHYDEGTGPEGAQPEDAEEATPAPEAALPVEQSSPQVPVAGQPQVSIPVEPTSPDVAKSYRNAIENERSAQEDIATAQAEQGRKESSILGGEVMNAQKELQSHQQREASRLQQQQQLATDIANTKIDPKAYFGKLDTGGKIATIAGLILGGLGSAGGSNKAVDALNEQVRQDVNAQKENLENKNSLYSKNLQATQDDRQATLLTQSQQLSIAQAKLGQAAAQAKTPMAQANLQMANAQLDRQQASISQQLYLYGLQNKIATGGRFDARLAPFSKNPASVVSLGDGTAIQASSPQAAGKVQEVLGTHQAPIDTLNRLEQLSVNPLKPASPEYQTARSLTSTLLTQLKGASGLGRLSPEGVKLLEQSFNDPTQLREAILHDERTKALKQSLINQRDAKIAPYLPSYRTRSSLGAHAKQ